MDPTVVEAKLIEVLETIQRDSGYPSIPITGSTRPLRDLKGFDTDISPTAIELFAESLGIDIPLGMNIFVSPDGRRVLTIDEIVSNVRAFAPVTG